MTENTKNSPKLSVVSTPIGNLQDISERALSTLRQADIIAAEDTRHTQKLLSHFEINKPKLESYHVHNEEEKAQQLIAQTLDKNLHLVLVSDAGTPCISDPGYALVQEAHRQDLKVEPIPGPSAITTLLSAVGVASGKFLFVGFLPTKQNALEIEVESWKSFSKSPIVFYETAPRLIKTLRMIEQKFPNAHINLGRELTKIHEEITHHAVTEAIDWAENHITLKGELVGVCIPGITDEKSPKELKNQIQTEAISRFKSGAKIKELLREYKDHPIARNELYDLLSRAKELAKEKK